MLSRLFKQQPVQRSRPKCAICSDVGVGLKSTTYSSSVWRRSSQRCGFCALIYKVIEPHVLVTQGRSDASISIYISESGHLTSQVARNGTLPFVKIEICRDKGEQMIAVHFSDSYLTTATHSQRLSMALD
jgi:hypothetical protein